MHKVFVIAEAGVNHNGSLEQAKKLVNEAALAGADAVKFQTFRAEDLVSRSAEKADYQKRTTPEGETQLSMLKKLEFDRAAHRELLEYCRGKNIMFLSSPFDLASIDMLAELDLDIFKIPSGEITNLPYLRKAGALGKKVILSTGMSGLEEIGKALDVLVESGTKKDDITVLHCNTEYPTPVEDVNLRAMLTIGREFGVNVGYSDHTTGIEISIAAAALGARVIEKHFTLDRELEGPDHKASLLPGELRELVATIRNLEKGLGDGVKNPSPSELKNILVARKSIVAAVPVNKGEAFTEFNITVKRPATGISPMKWDEVIGKTAKKDFKKDEIIEL